MKARYAIIISLIIVSSLFAGREEDFNFALKLFDDGYFDLAAEQFDRFVDNYPDDVRIPQAYFLRGRSFFRLEKWDEANAAFLRVALQYPENSSAAEAMYLSAQCLKLQEKWEEAARASSAIYDYYPRSEFAARGIVESGIIHRLLGQTGRATAVFQRILQGFPGTAAAATAYFYLAEMAEETDNLDQAMEYYQLAGKITEDDYLLAEIRVRQAFIFNRLGDWEAADRAIQSVENPPEFDQYARLIYAFWRQRRGDFKTAGDIIASILNETGIDSIRYRAELYLADNYYLQENFSEAYELYRSLPPSDSLSLRLGLVSLKLDSADLAVEAFAEVLTSAGSTDNKIVALNELLKLYRQGSIHAGVSSTLESHIPDIKDIPGWEWYAASMGIVSFQEGNYIIAREFFNLLDRVKSNWSDDVEYYLGTIAEAGGDTAEALAHYRKVLDEYPGGDFADEAGSRLEWLRVFIPVENLMEEMAGLSARSYNFPNDGVRALKWGQFYFRSFKNYSKAAEHFKIALQSGALSENEAEEALGLLTRCYEILSRNDPAMADSAGASMRTYIESHPQGEFAQRYGLHLLRLRVSAIEDTFASQKDYIDGLLELLNEHPQGGSRAEIMAEIVRIFTRCPPDYQRGIRYADTLLSESPDCEYAGRVMLDRARAKLASSDNIGAMEDYSAYVERSPKGSLIVEAVLGLVSIEPDLDKKISKVRELLKDYYYHSGCPALNEQLGDLYMQRKNYDDALRQYLLFTDGEVQQGSTDIEYKIGLAYQLSGDLVSAQEFLLDYIVSYPDGAHRDEALFILGELSEGTDRTPVALRFYQNLVTHGSGTGLDRAALERMAHIYYNIDRCSEGRKLFRQLAESEPDSSKRIEFEANEIIGLYRQGILSIAQEEASLFARRYRKYGELKRYQADFYLEKGKFLASEKNFNQALKAFKTISRKYQETQAAIEAEYETGKIFLITNRFEEALDILTAMPEKYPDNEILSLVYITLGTFYYRQRQMQNALVAFQRALDDTAAARLWPLALQNLSITYKDLGLYEAAISTIKRYIELFPNREDIPRKRFDAALMHLSLREYRRAIEELRQVELSAEGEFKVEVQFYLGEAYFEKGDFERAVLEYMKVKYLDPIGGLDWAVTAIYKAAQGYEKLGKYDEARKLYDEIIGRYGENSDFGRGAKKRLDAIKPQGSAR